VIGPQDGFDILGITRFRTCGEPDEVDEDDELPLAPHASYLSGSTA
jgi:hypothetical protein